jgi:flagellar hook-basal body complex protein FliE
MTIENIGGFLQSGNVEKIIEHGQAIEAPIPPTAQPGDSGMGAATRSFGDLLNDSLDKLNEVQLEADRAVKELAAGRNKNIHETMLLMEKADMSFRLAMQVRNKVIDAYREVMRMQV